MNRRDIFIGLIIVAGLGGLIYFWRRPEEKVDLTVPQTLSVEDQIEDKFNLQIPEDVERAELSDVSGGDASALATRKFEEETFTLSILADLSDPEEGKAYQGWMIKGEQEDEDYSQVSAGVLKVAKGGYLLEFTSGTDYSDHPQIIVSLESSLDNQMEERILQGSF